jgi:hypothetical protein
VGQVPVLVVIPMEVLMLLLDLNRFGTSNRHLWGTKIGRRW